MPQILLAKSTHPYLQLKLITLKSYFYCDYHGYEGLKHLLKVTLTNECLNVLSYYNM